MNRTFKPFAALWTSARSRALFWLQVDKTDSCWLWTGAKHKLGYGVLSAGGRRVKAHRASFFLHNGHIFTDMKVLHRCDVRNCVNPDHLFLGTQADNVADMVRKGRQRGTPRYADQNPMAKASWPVVERMRALHGAGWSQGRLAKEFGLAKMTVNRIVRNLSWKTA